MRRRFIFWAGNIKGVLVTLVWLCNIAGVGLLSNLVLNIRRPDKKIQADPKLKVKWGFNSKEHKALVHIEVS